MKVSIDYSSLGKSSPISRFIQKSSNDVLLDTFCLGYKQRQSMETSEISTIITNILSQQYLDSEKNTRKNITEQQNNIRSQISDIKELNSSQIEIVKNEINNIKQQISRLPQEVYDKETPAILKDIINKLNKLDDPYSEIITRMNSFDKTLQNQYDGFINKRFNELKQDMSLYGKQQQSYEKGLRGEELVRKHLLDFFDKGIIEDTRPGGHRGDFIFSLSDEEYNIKILIEVKNYNDKNVPTAEIEKFHRDMKNYDAGIIISLNAGIAKYKHMTEEVKNNKIIVYIPKADESCFSLYYAIIFINTLSKYKYEQKKYTESKSESSHAEIDPQILDNIIKALYPIKESVKHYSGLFNTLKKIGTKINKEVESMITESKKVIESNQRVVQDTIDNIIEGCENKESPKDIKPYENFTDLLIYKDREEKIETKVGTFVIRRRTADIVLYEKSSSREIKTFRHMKTQKSELSAYKKCKDIIEYMKKHEKYIPPRRNNKDGKIEPLPPPFIPHVILERMKIEIPRNNNTPTTRIA